MKCPYCQHEQTKVTNKRNASNATRRRRECLKCKKRFTTYERFELELYVIKKDGRKEPYQRKKLSEGIKKSMEKRPHTTPQIEEIINNIETQLHKKAKGKDIKSNTIGKIIMNKLKQKDNIAYIRFASVYKEFKDKEDFKKEIGELK